MKLDTRLAAKYDALAERGSASAPAVPHAQPTETHRKVIEVTHSLLERCVQASDKDVPTSLKVAVRTFRRLEPTLLEEISTIPEESVREALTEVQRIIARVLTPTPG